MKNASTFRVVLTALFAALVCVATMTIRIPSPTGGYLNLGDGIVLLSAFLLGPVYGTLAVGVYLLLGAAGLPVFSGFTGGIGRFIGPTGGFLWGFLLLAAGCGLVRGRSLPLRFLPGLAGLLLCPLLGVWWYARTAGPAFPAAALSVSIPFLPKDVSSLVFALAFARLLEKRGVLR